MSFLNATNTTSFFIFTYQLRSIQALFNLAIRPRFPSVSINLRKNFSELRFLSQKSLSFKVYISDIINKQCLSIDVSAGKYELKSDRYIFATNEEIEPLNFSLIFLFQRIHIFIQVFSFKKLTEQL